MSEGAVLETGCVYIVPLLKSLKLPKGISAAANPKSSTGRLDIFTRVIADHAQEFDKMPEGYEGALLRKYLPRTFSILARTGSRLSQIRFRAGAPLALRRDHPGTSCKGKPDRRGRSQYRQWAGADHRSFGSR